MTERLSGTGLAREDIREGDAIVAGLSDASFRVARGHENSSGSSMEYIPQGAKCRLEDRLLRRVTKQNAYERETLLRKERAKWGPWQMFVCGWVCGVGACYVAISILRHWWG